MSEIREEDFAPYGAQPKAIDVLNKNLNLLAVDLDLRGWDPMKLIKFLYGFALSYNSVSVELKEDPSLWERIQISAPIANSLVNKIGENFSGNVYLIEKDIKETETGKKKSKEIHELIEELKKSVREYKKAFEEEIEGETTVSINLLKKISEKWETNTKEPKKKMAEILEEINKNDELPLLAIEYLNILNERAKSEIGNRFSVYIVPIIVYSAFVTVIINLLIYFISKIFRKKE